MFEIQEWKDELQKKLFKRFAFPVSKNFWTTWSNDPAEWTPITHSCDPNTWIKGLDFVARR